ncbi:hypothetical protein HYFRA_00001907 [Hymenoscyphus fraxineus]|uniref:Uncharacterized protein n=1 Tax=Hymenoscyphus fraxineus TaxID=746836 RepID=A0A9N9PMC5_9HELO|nr:hypothetical protein HYFRA_00001907 [Hymenoscyphus fraxineus]
MSSALLAMQLAKSRYPPNTAIPLQLIHEECHGSLKGTMSPERYKYGESSKSNSTEANSSTPDTETFNMSQDSPRESGDDTSHGGTPSTSTPDTETLNMSRDSPRESGEDTSHGGTPSTSTPDTETLNMSRDSPRESGEDTSHGGTPSTSTPDTETPNMSPNSPQESEEDTSPGETPPTTTTASPIQNSAEEKSTLDPTSAHFIPAEYVPKRAELMTADRLDMLYRAQKEFLQMDCIGSYQRDNSWQQHEIASLKTALRMESVIGVGKRLNPAVKEFVPSMERMCPLNGFSQKRLDNLDARIVVMEQESGRLRCEMGLFVEFGRMKCFG